MKLKEAEQYVWPSDRWWKYSVIFTPSYWAWVIFVWIVGNLVERFRRSAG